MQPEILENQVSYPSLWYLDRCLGFPNEHFFPAHKLFAKKQWKGLGVRRIF